MYRLHIGEVKLLNYSSPVVSWCFENVPGEEA